MGLMTGKKGLIFGVSKIPTRLKRIDNFFKDSFSLRKDITLGHSNEFLKSAAYWEKVFRYYVANGLSELSNGKAYTEDIFTREFGSFTNLAVTFGGIDRLRKEFDLVFSQVYSDE